MIKEKDVITEVNATQRWNLLRSLREIYMYREMLILWLWRDIKVRYTQSTLGIAWSLFPMLSQVLIYSLIFGKLVRIDSDGAPYALFALTGIVPWIFFSQALSNVSSSVYGAGQFIHKIYFPRMILPIAALADKFFDFSVSFVLLIIVLVVSGYQFSWDVIFIPFLILLMIMNVLGIGMFAAAMAVHFRDILHFMSYITLAMMYASPVVYPVSLVPEQYQLIYGLNPMVGIIEGFRAILLSTRPIPWDLIAISATVGTISLIIGVLYFLSSEAKFADVG